MKSIKISLFLTVLCAVSACADFTEVNRDPTSATTISPDLLIPTIQFSHSNGFNNVTRYFIFPGIICNHWTGPWSAVEYGGKLQKELGYMERLWLTYYGEGARNLVALENLVDGDAEMDNYSAIAKVLRVELFLKMTDYYGDIPYFEGGQGYFGGIMNPRYDRQEDIYMDFFTRLDDALAQFDGSKRTPKSDFYYSGDVEKWKRFTNSLKLRIAMRLIKVDPEMAKEKAAEAFRAGIMTSNDDIAMVRHEDDVRDGYGGNGYAVNFQQFHNERGPSQFRLTTELFSALTIRDTEDYRRLRAEDPRLLLAARCYDNQLFANAIDITEACRTYNMTRNLSPADPTTGVDGTVNIGGYLTVPAQEFVYGSGIQREHGVNLARNVWAAAIPPANLPAGVVFTESSKTALHHSQQRLMPSKWLMAANSPWIHLSYAETQFLMAETTLRGWGIDDMSVEQRYRNGYMAAVDQWNLFSAPVPPTADVESYMNTWLIPAIREGGTAAMEEVMKQLWIIHMVDPIEAWSLIRRTNGMPTEFTRFYNRYPEQNETNGRRIRRLQYPWDEQEKNKANYDEAVARMGGVDDWMTPVWWDVD